MTSSAKLTDLYDQKNCIFINIITYYPMGKLVLGCLFIICLLFVYRRTYFYDEKWLHYPPPEVGILLSSQSAQRIINQTLFNKVIISKLQFYPHTKNSGTLLTSQSEKDQQLFSHD